MSDELMKVESVRFDKDRGELIVSFDSDKHYAINISNGEYSNEVSRKLISVGNMIRFGVVEDHG